MPKMTADCASMACHYSQSLAALNELIALILESLNFTALPTDYL